MTPCIRCGSVKVGQIIGIATIGNVPHHIQHNCPCGTTRGIPWAGATDTQRREAELVQESRDKGAVMTCR